MKKKHLLIIFTIAILALALSSCTGGRLLASGWPGITTDGDVAYVAFNTHVYAVNLTGGTEKWRFPAEPDNNITFYAAPAVTEDGQVISGGYDNVLYSINSDTGQENWQFIEAQDRYIGSPLVAQDMIYAPVSDGNLYALGLDGQPTWPAPFIAEESNWSRPSTQENCDCIYLASMDHSVYAIDRDSGTELWRSTPLGGASVGIPAVSEDGVIYIGTFINELVALDAETGAVLWRLPTADWAWGSPTIDGDMLYFSDISGILYGVNRQTQAQVWQVESGSRIVGAPLVVEDSIYFTTEAGVLFAVNREGTTRWTKDFEATLHTGPVSAGETILVASDEDGLILYALDTNGTQKWMFAPAEK